ncbi:MAG TPA: carbamoyltransferase HypF, partial [Anaerolineae bacterium]|nr:carbamoyltransferase HypF [Anaerolineae bacterium]
LACDATDEAAVRMLRERKGRPAKPLAVMMATLEEVKGHCWVSEEEERLLTSPQCPIVLLPWRPESSVSRLVAPRNNYLGVMLPYTPLHHILLRDVGRPLVMTSGNLSEEPIACDNDEALRRLAHLADYFLLHNRDIYARYDDSVWFVPHTSRFTSHVSRLTFHAQPIRRSRGYAPFPVKLPFKVRQILACGAELKNTFCVTRDEYAFLSQHIGDMENLETLAHFETTIKLYKRLFRIEPEIIACDMHPEYLATKYAKEQEARGKRQEARGILHPASCILYPVQHHHAHIASCLADNGWSSDDGPVIGVAWDGTGYGTDGHIWGGEFLVADYQGFRRAAHLEYLPMPGGEAAIRNPYRLAIGYLYALTGCPPSLPPNFGGEGLPSPRVGGGAGGGGCAGEEELRIIQQQVDKGINCPQTSAGGRLFDAVSALLGIRACITYEAQAAVELEMAAQSPKPKAQSPIRSYPFGVEEEGDGLVIRLRPLFEALLTDLQGGMVVGEMAYRFHVTVAEMMGALCERIAQETGLRTVALSGGCFQNRLLLTLVVPRLREVGLRVLLHRRVPCNDGGVSLGQAVIAHFAVN